MGFSRDDERALLANSGGRCCNPACRKNLLIEYEGRRATIAEMAHIIARSKTGPRGECDLDPDERDIYDNALLLCPNCHTEVDEFPDTFPPDLLRTWKTGREREVAEGTETPRYENRNTLMNEIRRLLRNNHAIWSTVGPGGPEGGKAQAQTVGQWRRQLRETIVPNNWRVLALGRHNEQLLTQDELHALAEFRVHADALAFNALADQPVEGQIRYPESMQRHFV
ncbi:MAG TPA: HNH endonuclease [Solirubrobacterales bacterium]|nr:HNH endonuclease [Solirubrobacterales bacterium]